MANKIFYTVEVTTTQLVKVEIDTDIIDENWMQQYKEDFTNIDTLEDHARQIAWLHARMPEQTFLEGYGEIKLDDYDSDSSASTSGIVISPEEPKYEAEIIRTPESE